MDDDKMDIATSKTSPKDENPLGRAIITNQDEIDRWKEKDVDACSIIFYNIEPAYQTTIEGSNTAHEMWNRLPSNMPRHLLLKPHSY
jgi:hypothetical protein